MEISGGEKSDQNKNTLFLIMFSNADKQFGLFSIFCTITIVQQICYIFNACTLQQWNYVTFGSTTFVKTQFSEKIVKSKKSLYEPQKPSSLLFEMIKGKHCQTSTRLVGFLGNKLPFGISSIQSEYNI